MRLGLGLWFVMLGAPVQCNAELQWEKTVEETQVGLEEAVVVFRFPFTNTGKDTVKITKVLGCCGCAAKVLPKDSFPPGGKGTIEATLELGSTIGRVSKIVVVQADHANSVTPLTLVALTPNPVKVSPEQVTWSMGATAEAKTVRVIATHPGVTVVEAKSARSGLDVEVKPSQDAGVYDIVMRPVTTEGTFRSFITISLELEIVSEKGKGKIRKSIKYPVSVE